MQKIFLLADDDDDDIEMFRDALQETDPDVLCHSANDGREALQLLANGAFGLPHVIILDVNMPRMDGWQCLAELKREEAYRHLPVLMYSTSSIEYDAQKALDGGALCFFTKPMSYVELKEILHVVAANVHGDLRAAMDRYNRQKAKKVFACAPEHDKGTGLQDFSGLT